MRNPENIHLSNLVGNLLYTTKKQLLISSRSNIFLADDSWILAIFPYISAIFRIRKFYPQFARRKPITTRRLAR